MPTPMPYAITRRDDGLLIDEAKAGILAASVVAGLAGFVFLLFVSGEPDEEAVELPQQANAFSSSPSEG